MKQRYPADSSVTARLLRPLQLCLLGIALVCWPGNVGYAQDTSDPEVEAAQQYTIEQALGKESVPVVGKLISTASVNPGFSRRNGFILEDLSPARERMVVYTNSNVPPADKLIFVRGKMTGQSVSVNDRTSYPLFLAEGWKEGLPQAAGAVAGSTGGNDSGRLVLLIATFGILAFGGVVVFLGLTQRATRKKQQGQTASAPGNHPGGPAMPPPATSSTSGDRLPFVGRSAAPPPSAEPVAAPPAGPSPGPRRGAFSPGAPTDYPDHLPAPHAAPSTPSPPPAPPVPQPVVSAREPEVSVPLPSIPLAKETREASKQAVAAAALAGVLASPEGSETVFERGETISALPAYFEVVSGGAETPGARKVLFSAGGRLTFDIARPANGQDIIANFIPIKSALVSRNPNNQGKIVHDPKRGVYILRNLADPGQRKNPIKVQGVPMKPSEEHVLTDGDLIQVGDVTLRFHRE